MHDQAAEDSVLGPASLRPGGQLHSAVAGLHDAGSRYSVVYHPLCVGKRLIVRGKDHDVQVVEIEDWQGATGRITELEAKEAAKAAGFKKEAWLWSTGDRILASDVPTRGGAHFKCIAERGWKRVFGFDQKVPVDNLSLTEDSEIACFVAAAAAFAAFGYSQPIIWSQPTRRKASLKQGESIALSIIATGGHHYTWYQNDTVSRHTVNRATIVLRSLVFQDQGSYSCLVSHASTGATTRSEAVSISMSDPGKRAEEIAALKMKWMHTLLSGTHGLSDDELIAALEIDDCDDNFCATILSTLAQRALERGERQRALYRASDAATRCPANLRAQLLRAEAAASFGYFFEAKRAYEAAYTLSTDPDQKKSIQATLIQLEAKYQAKADDVFPPPLQRKKKSTSQPEADLALLNLKPGHAPFSKRDLRRAYLKIAKVKHPDKKGGDHESFLLIQSAYERLLLCSSSSVAPSATGPS